MKNSKLALAVSFCAAILNQVALELNGGQPLPEVPPAPLSSLTTLVQGPQSARSRKADVPKAGARGCALKGCGKPNRTKGYCAAHYQKLRMLEKTGRRPAAWKDYATPGSVADIALPRGRAGSKALAELAAKRKQSA